MTQTQSLQESPHHSDKESDIESPQESSDEDYNNVMYD